jgi:transcriptional regulator with XRE-family HTH domain
MAIAGQELLDAPRLIRTRRDTLGLTRRALAKKSGISVATIERAETAGTTVSYQSLINIVAALGGEVVIKFDESGKE